MRPLLLAFAAAVVAAAPAHAAPRCFGAASRDRDRPCHNAALRHRVTPTPDQAQLTPSDNCTQDVDKPLDDCGYGSTSPTATVAMLGDSHAQHWRPGLDVAARALGWHVDEFAGPHCAFTDAQPDSGPYFDKHCPQVKDDVVAYLQQHPETQTVFVSAQTHQPIVVPPGQGAFATRVQGYVDAWADLPASVTRIVVLRDVPLDRYNTFDCVRDSIRRHLVAAHHCRVTRSHAMAPDAEVAAAARDGRARVLDFTRQMCGARYCYPVVGGVLVHKDTNHLGALFAKTLGPILLRSIRGL